MLKVKICTQIGTWSSDSAKDTRTEFVTFETFQSMSAPNSVCCISIYRLSSLELGLPVQTTRVANKRIYSAQNALSVKVRGSAIKYNDPITIELTAGDLSGKLISAEVKSIQTLLRHTNILGATGIQAIANSRLNQVYENQSLSQIVNNLASQTGISTGQIETGSTYPYLVVHEGKSVLDHIRQLAMRDGLDIYFDTDNKLTLQKFNKSKADHTLTYGIDILDLQLLNQRSMNDQIRVYGESPVSKQGTDTWPWLAKDLTPFQGEVGQGGQFLAIQDGAVRTKEAAAQLAVAKFGAIKDQATWGRLKILGNPTVKLADAIEIKNAPRPELNGLFKVTSVRHVLNKQSGFLTFVGFTGHSGIKAAAYQPG
jgi:hypothetical protein